MAQVRKTAYVGSSGKIEIIIDTGVQSVAKNTTLVRVRGLMYNSSGRSYDFTSGGVSRKITGTASWSGTFNFDLASNEVYTFIDHTFEIGHNADGSKAVSFTVTLGPTVTGTFGNGGSVGASMTLPPIDRLPGQPGMPIPEPVSPGIVDVTWTAASSGGATIREYQVMWDIHVNFRSDNYLRNSTALTRRISGLTPLTTYYFRVRARNDVGWGEWSKIMTYITTDVPSAPGAPVLTHSQGTDIQASWSAASAHGRTITNYQLQVDDNSSFSSPSTANTGTTLSHTIVGAEMGKTWYVRVRAQNDQGYGPWSDIRSLAVPKEPAQVGLLTLSYNPPESLTVSWSAPNNGGASITGYELQYGQNSFFYVGETTTIETTSRSVTLNDLEIGEEYYVRVRAINKQGEGDWSPRAEKLIASGPRVRHDGVWRNSIAWVKHNGVWRIATPLVRSGGVWRIGGG